MSDIMPHFRLSVGLALSMSVSMILGSAAIAQVNLTPFRNEIVFNFQNDRGAETRSVRLDMSESATATPTAVVLGDFTSNGPFVVPAGDVATSLRPDPATETIRLDVTVDPSISEWKAGEFTSSIRVAGDGYESTTIPVKLTFRSGSPTRGVLVAIVVLAIGVGIGLLFRAKQGNPNQPDLSAASVARKRVIMAAKILTGVVTAVVIVLFGFDTQYLNNDTFGAGGFSDWLTLFAWGFAAGFAGKTISDFTATTTTP